MIKIVENNLVRKEVVSSTTFELVLSLFCSLCYHYESLDQKIHTKNGLRSSPIFIAAGRETLLKRFAVVNFPWTATNFTPFGTGIPPHVMLLSEIQCLKASFKQQTNTIVEGMREELNRRNVGGDAFRADCVLDDIKIANESFLSKLGEMPGVNNRKNEDRAEEIAEDYFVLNYSHPFEDVGGGVGGSDSAGDGVRSDSAGDGVRGDSGGDGVRSDSGGDGVESDHRVNGRGGVEESATVDDSKGLMISWKNCRGGSILLTDSSFVFPSMTFPNMLTMWFCGDMSKSIPPYRMLKAKDVKHVKGGKQKLSNMKYLVAQVIRAATIANRADLVMRSWSPGKVLALYRGVKHFFAFPTLLNGKARRYDTISWKTYFNTLTKRRGKLFGEQ